MLEIVLTLETAVGHMEMEEEDGPDGIQLSNTFSGSLTTPSSSQPSQSQQPLPPRKHSDLPSKSCVSEMLVEVGKCQNCVLGEKVDGPMNESPLPPAEVGLIGSGETVKRRHSRGKSVTSKAEMMSRPSSARAKMEVTTQSKEHRRPMSPPAVSGLCMNQL